MSQAEVAIIRTSECGRARRCGGKTDGGRKKGREVGCGCGLSEIKYGMGKGPGLKPGAGMQGGWLQKGIYRYPLVGKDAEAGDRERGRVERKRKTVHTLSQ
ncbi:hypothetical protein B0T20DRAFT_415517 [Sordaria brevicollis]|uniref:Uncharacterized protein n=1 Tax=Sordaria brevicollis TaxID=83679 RepID=A0AAE0PC30_SORBR|nr:hypothetical protein B0T20DRAFT_415517 [Sordaria brevicollis]